MTIVYYIWDVLYASANRLLARKVTTFAAVLGLTIAISILLSISIYADGIYYESFLNNVADTRENPENEGSTDNPTFAFLYHYNSGWHGLKTWNDLLPLDNYLTQDGVNLLDIPSIDVIRLFETDTFYLFPEDNSADINSLYLSRSKFGVMTNLDKHASLVAGRFPNSNTNSHKDSVEIIVNQNLAAKAGLRINQDFLAYFKIITASGERETIHVPVHIVGIWKPTNPAEDYWIFAPSYYEQILFTGEETFFSRLGSNFPKFIDSGYWYLIMDADYVHADEIDSLLRRIDRMERGANEIIPDLWLSISPRNALEEYQIDARTLRILLYAFSIPIIGLVLAFINLVSHLTTQQRRNEIAVIRSRGGTVNQVIGFSALDGLIISVVSLSLIPFISMWLAKFISRTVSYSQFSANSAMRISFSRGAAQIGFFTILIFLGMLLIPISRASQLTVISYRNLISRITKNPWWQRAWLDLILLIPAVYGFYLLREQGSLAQLGTQGMSNDPFRNPILFLIPSLGILSLSLFSLRLISPFITVLEVLISWTPWTSLIIASRQIARRPIDYHAPLLILILTISLFVYTASLATTFDQHLAAQEYYRIGADVQFFDPGDSTVSGDNYMWDFFPVDEYAGIEGVQSAARMGRYAVVVKTARIQSKGIFIGIDRLSFPKVVYWRGDFAENSLGELMNNLAKDPTNVLVNSEFLNQTGLQIGDRIEGTVKSYNQENKLDLIIAGTVEYFPTWYPDLGPLLVGNLDNLFLNANGMFPYHVLLKSDPGIDPTTIKYDRIRTTDQRIRPVDWKTPTQSIQQAQGTPERQGLIGILFIGSIATVLLTVIAYLLHLVFSFQGRQVELSVLRAGGLSIFQMTMILLWEFLYLIIFGGSLGTLFGLLSGINFIPFLQVGEGSGTMIPPFKVLVPWDLIVRFYWLFVILFVISLLTSILLLKRSRIFEAIKLGESI